MPELPEIETVRRTLGPIVVGRTLEDVRVTEPRLRYPVDEARLRERVVGRRIRSAERRAKYLILPVDGGSRLVVHLGMSGRLRVVRKDAPSESHEHVAFDLGAGDELRYRDPRRFGFIHAVDDAPLEGHRFFRHLGVEPLSEALTGDYLHERARGTRRAVKGFLMDATVVVGVGNIYASEALFEAGVHPSRAAGRVARHRWSAVARAVKDILAAAIRRGGTTLNDFRDVHGESGEFQGVLRVYDRAGAPCPRGCDSVVRRKVIAQRSSYYCPRCQR